MKINYTDHYDEKYWTNQKEYRDAHGNVQRYNNPSLDWGGFDEVFKALNPLLPGETLLDIACGGGGLTSRFLSAGRSAYGCDISEHAVENCVPDMRGHITTADATNPSKGNMVAWHTNNHFPVMFDSIISTDFLEHLYEEDLDGVLDWFDRITEPGGFAFHLIATVGSRAEEFVLGKGETVPKEKEVTAVSGHVNVRTWKYWAKKFLNRGWTIRWDLMYRFQRQRATVDWWVPMEQWGHDCTWFLQMP